MCSKIPKLGRLITLTSFLLVVICFNFDDSSFFRFGGAQYCSCKMKSDNVEIPPNDQVLVNELLRKFETDSEMTHKT